MKRFAVSVSLALMMALGQASGDLVILKSGKTIEGVVSPREDTGSFEVVIPSGKIELSQEMVEEILTEDEAKAWKQQQEQLQVESEEVQGAVLEVLSKDQPVIQEQSLRDVGAQDQRFVLDRLVQSPPAHVSLLE